MKKCDLCKRYHPSVKTYTYTFAGTKRESDLCNLCAGTSTAESVTIWAGQDNGAKIAIAEFAGRLATMIEDLKKELL